MEFINQSVAISDNTGLTFIKFGEAKDGSKDLMAPRPITVDPEEMTESFKALVNSLPSLVDPVAKLNFDLCPMPELLLQLEMESFVVRWRDGWRDAAVIALSAAKQALNQAAAKPLVPDEENPDNADALVN